MIKLSASASIDGDGDGIPDVCDVCPDEPDLAQPDVDRDGIGDSCDACAGDPENDLDGDGLCADRDPCPTDAQNDVDGDSVCATEDNCPLKANPDQLDLDADGRGDACADTPCYSIALAIEPPDSGGVGITPPNCGASQYEEGTFVELTAEAFEEFGFDGWLGDASGSSMPLSVQVGDNLQVTARFEAEAPAACIGDCDQDGAVTVGELIRGVNIALGNQPASACPALDDNRDGSVTVAELVRGVRNALQSCGGGA